LQEHAPMCKGKNLSRREEEVAVAPGRGTQGDTGVRQNENRKKGTKFISSGKGGIFFYS